MLAATGVAALAAGGCDGGEPSKRPGDEKRRGSAATELRQPTYAGDPGARRDPEADAPRVLSSLGSPARARGDELAPKIRGSERLNLARFMARMSNDVATFWQQQFNGARYKFEPIPVRIVTRSGRTSCDPPGAYDTNSANAFYCADDPAIHLPVGFFRKRINRVGDTATAIVIAHEWGHRVQAVLGLLEAGAGSRVTGRQLEMHADCLAGVWLSTVVQRKLLEKGDLREAMRITSAAGDAPGTPVEEQHGTAGERVRAFMAGFDGGSSESCPIGRFKPRA